MFHRRLIAGVVVLIVLGVAVCAGQEPASGSTVVYVTKTGAKYHQAGCSSLRRSAIPMKLAEAAKRYGPCLNCKPPRLPGAAGAAAAVPLVSKKPPAATGGRCQAITKKGTQCSRRAKPGSAYCWQHGR